MKKIYKFFTKKKEEKEMEFMIDDSITTKNFWAECSGCGARFKATETSRGKEKIKDPCYCGSKKYRFFKPLTKEEQQRIDEALNL